MIVTEELLPEVIYSLEHCPVISVDTETTGLYPYLGDKLFSVIIHTGAQGYYFNFNQGPDYLGKYAPDILPDPVVLTPVLSHPDKSYLLHNAKFDLHFLAQAGLKINGRVICTQAVSRVYKNNVPGGYSLANLGDLIGHPKDDTVEKYIAEHRLYTMVDVPGKKKRERKPHYDKVPYIIMANYGIQDANVCFHLGHHVLKKLVEEKNGRDGQNSPATVGENEIALTKVLFDMERVGVKIDRRYCIDAYEHELEKYTEADFQLTQIAGEEFKDGRKFLVALFDKLGLEYPLTEKGNPCFKDDVLPDHAVINILKEYREAYKRAGTYFQTFLDLADTEDIIRCNFRQGGTATGRLSCSNPNLQNVPKKENGEYKARACFVPREGFFFVAMDYDQMEYRLMLDYAEEMDVIKRVLEGTDVHTATAEIMGVDRTLAKTINFMLLYGGGAGKLASTLGITEAEAKARINEYFRALPGVKGLINTVKQTAKARGYVYNWLGRRCYVDNNDAYKAPNYLIQGGCADIVKVAMVELHALLKEFKSRMVLTIHDEILFEIANDETFLIPILRDVMQSAYPYKHVPLTVGVEYSTTNWADKLPYGEETGDEIS